MEPSTKPTVSWMLGGVDVASRGEERRDVRKSLKLLARLGDPLLNIIINLHCALPTSTGTGAVKVRVREVLGHDREKVYNLQTVRSLSRGAIKAPSRPIFWDDLQGSRGIEHLCWTLTNGV